VAAHGALVVCGQVRPIRGTRGIDGLPGALLACDQAVCAGGERTGGRWRARGVGVRLPGAVTGGLADCGWDAGRR
jgi:hypothetical protein